MPNIETLGVEFTANHVKYDRGLNHVSKGNKRLRGEFLNLQSVATALFATGGMAYGAKKIFDIGSAAEETASKFRTVFGPATETVQGFVDEFGVMAGLSQTAAREVIATTGAIVQGMGLSQKASAAYAEEVVRLAGDLSSFNNIPITETSRAIQAAITGEREQLKRLGIVVMEADVQKRALALSGKALASELTQEDKATATLQLVTEKAGVAVGDLARTQDSAANRARQLSARFTNIKETLAVGVMPVFNELLDGLDNLTGGFDTSGAAGLRFQAFTLSAIGQLQRLGVEAALAASAMRLVAEVTPAADVGRGAKGLVNAWVHPIETLRDAAGAAVNPVQTLQSLLSNKSSGISNAWQGFENTRSAAAEMREEIRGQTLQAIADLNNMVANLANGSGSGGEGGGGMEGLAEQIRQAQREAAAFLPPLERFAAVGGILSENGGMVESVGFVNVGFQEMNQRIKATGESMDKFSHESAAAIMTSMEYGQRFGEMFAGTIASATNDGIAAFKHFASEVKRMLIETAAKFLLFKAFSAASGPVGAFGSFLGESWGFRASGGPVSAGQPYVVGERGPELMVPQVSGHVVPNHAMGTSSAPINIYLLTQDGRQVVDKVTVQQRRDANMDNTHRVNLPVAVVGA